MKRDNYLDLLSQRSELNQLLEDAGDLDEITRRSVGLRRSLVEKELAELEKPTRAKFKAALTFAGEPVVGSYGIVAKFATEAAGQFAEAIASVAASLVGPLSTKGQIPNRDQYEMLIVGLAHGSYGFVLEEASDPTLLPSPVEDAVLAVQQLFAALSEEEQEAVAEIVASLNPRALTATRKFLTTVAEANAVCAVGSDNRVTQFQNVEEIKRGIDTLRDENVITKKVELEGVVEGVLPNGRRFEFRSENGLVTGKLSPEAELDAIRRAEISGEQVRGVFDEKQVGTARPRYILRTVETLNRPGREDYRQIEL